MTTQTTNSTAVDELVSRARSLYSLPAVAAEVIQLTSNPQVNTLALKECIQTDPALTAKILRVVNSSLFGLSREVCDLNQALALLGTKPLKLLVLGFSLPDNLFAEVAREQLDWYWSTTLTRAVAAREISEQLFDRPGDDAFLAGLFQDIGVLVLLGELKEPYARFLAGVIEQRVDLQRLEVDSLGFDHLQLTAALLEHWKMPKVLVRAISEPREYTQLMKSDEEHAELTKVVHLAGLVAELVGQNRLGVLPDLMEVGAAYCDLDKEQLNELVGTLQPKVKQLAEVLSLEVAATTETATDYVEIMTAAHRQMSELTEEVVELLGHPPLEEEEAYSNLLADATHLRQTVDRFLHHTVPPTPSSPAATAAAIPQSNQQTPPPLAQGGHATKTQAGPTVDFSEQLTLTIGHCRSRRQPVSLLLLEMGGESSSDAQGRPVLGQVLEMASRSINVPNMICEVINPCRRVLVLPKCDRHEAVRFAEETLRRVEKMVLHLEQQGTVLKYIASAGVASVSLPPKNFPPQDLLETAGRCLSAAQSSGTCVVKSLEIY
ncbi:MAG: HDOD domain-containing protein [Planctomycetes bacterium]|nr:HDOD domain-containing protein [Planctomycetota bacterium]